MAEVKLYGTWSSPFSYRVKWALKLKGITFEYIDEDLLHKSSLLLQYNPIYKKIPVLVHAGKPICDYIVIDEYIEETWPHNPMLPADPYERSVARFWIKFAQDKAIAIHDTFFRPKQEVENAMTGICEMLEAVEEHGLLAEKKFFNGDKIGLVDITFASIIFLLQLMESVIGAKAFESQKFPSVYEWLENFKQAPVIKEDLPNLDEMVLYSKHIREKYMA